MQQFQPAGNKCCDFEVSFFNLDFACNFFGFCFSSWKRKIQSGPALPLSLNTFFFFYLLHTSFSFLLLTSETQLNSDTWNPEWRSPRTPPQQPPGGPFPMGKGKDKTTENTNCPFSNHKEESGSTLLFNQTSHPFIFGSLVLYQYSAGQPWHRNSERRETTRFGSPNLFDMSSAIRGLCVTQGQTKSSWFCYPALR